MSKKEHSVLDRTVIFLLQQEQVAKKSRKWRGLKQFCSSFIKTIPKILKTIFKTLVFYD